MDEQHELIVSLIIFMFIMNAVLNIGFYLAMINFIHRQLGTESD